MTNFIHLPVLADSILDAFKPLPHKRIVDGTLGGAGHTRLLLQNGASVIGIDQDPYALERVRSENLDHLQVLQGNFRHMNTLLANINVHQVDGVLLDIGVSSFQLDDHSRGFSYHEEAALDMRMSQDGLSAYEVVNEYEVEDLAAILYEYGEERHSRRIARAIEAARPIETTTQLAQIIKQAYPGGFAKGIHPARRSFQALRIYVNDELGALRDALQASLEILKPGGVLAVISFHSLEDRIVKQFMRGDHGITPINKRPIIADENELAVNPRSRSAKLRLGTKT